MVILFIKLKTIVGEPNLSDQFKKIIKRYKKRWDITLISCDGLHAWLLTQSQFIAMVSTVGKASGSMTTLPKTFICRLVSDACLWLGALWLNLRYSLALTICESWARFFVSL